MSYTFTMKNYPGILIAIDGIDGAGKTTQVQLLKNALEGAGETVIVSKEPTDGEWGKKLRDSALAGRLPIDEELELFIQDRQDHLKKKIVPALEAGQIIILDRYFYSTIAYQGILVDDHKAIEGRIRENVVLPDVAFWLDIPADLAVSRVVARDGRANLFERQEDLAKAGEIFKQIAESDTVLRRIDATMSPDLLYRSIIKILLAGPIKAKRCGKSYGCDDPMYCMPRITDTCPWWSISKKLTADSALV